MKAAWAVFGAYNGAPFSNWSWRIPTLVQTVAPFVQLLLVW